MIAEKAVASMTELNVELFDEANTPELDAFLRRNRHSTVFHTLQWHRIIQETYGHTCDYWAAFSNHQIVGVFPVVVVRHPIMGTKMLAMAYQFHSGLPLATSEAVQTELIKRAIGRAREIGAKYLEIRHHEPASFLTKLGFVQMDSQLVTTSAPLEGLDFKQIRRNHRRNILHAIEHGVSISEGKTLDDLEAFRRIYLIEGRKLGAPQAGWNFFKNLHCLARSRYRLFLARLSNRCLGGLLTLEDGRTVFARCLAHSSREAVELHAGKLLYWRAMCDAAQRGCQSFNFGISWHLDSGLIHAN